MYRKHSSVFLEYLVCTSMSLERIRLGFAKVILSPLMHNIVGSMKGQTVFSCCVLEPYTYTNGAFLYPQYIVTFF